jgi:hypothetical protein
VGQVILKSIIRVQDRVTVVTEGTAEEMGGPKLASLLCTYNGSDDSRLLGLTPDYREPLDLNQKMKIGNGKLLP